MQTLGQRFEAVGDNLLELVNLSVAERPPNLSDSQFEALQRLGRAAASGALLDEVLGEDTQ